MNHVWKIAQNISIHLFVAEGFNESKIEKNLNQQ